MVVVVVVIIKHYSSFFFFFYYYYYYFPLEIVDPWHGMAWYSIMWQCKFTGFTDWPVKGSMGDCVDVIGPLFVNEPFFSPGVLGHLVLRRT